MTEELKSYRYKGVDYSDGLRVPDRRRKPQRSRRWRVGEMWELHDEIARRILLGQKNTVIAEALGCTATTVSNVRNSPVVQDKLAIMRGARDASTVDIARQIQEFAPTALQLLKDTINGQGDGQNASIALRVAQANKWLDRAGYVPVKKFEGVTAHLTKDDIAEIRARALGNNSPVVSDDDEVNDADYEVVKEALNG